MGKHKTGVFPGLEPVTHYVTIQNNEIDNLTIAWGDSVVWSNQDSVTHSLAWLDANGNPDRNNPLGPPLGPKGSATANSVEFSYAWQRQPPPPKEPEIYKYGLLDHPTSKATLTIQLKI